MMMEYLPWHISDLFLLLPSFGQRYDRAYRLGQMAGGGLTSQGEQVSPSIIHPATARNPGIERLAIDSFPTTAVSN